MPVEVERKFVCDTHILEKLKEIGDVSPGSGSYSTSSSDTKDMDDVEYDPEPGDTSAVCLGQYEFKDQYFDSADFTLTLKDFWLRKREGSWELKRSKSSHSNAEKRAQGGCTKYREITDMLQIRAELMDVYVDPTSDSFQTERGKDVHEFEKWLQEMKLECFAEFTTQRCSYALEYDEGDGKVRVDLDRADFGYCVGEIEVLVAEGNEMKSAMQSIKKTAEILGISGEQKTRGKMEVYLQRFRPDHYTELLKTHVL